MSLDEKQKSEFAEAFLGQTHARKSRDEKEDKSHPNI